MLRAFYGADPYGPMTPEEIAIAKRVCHDCPVWRHCLITALAMEDEHGVWGGLTPSERRKLVREHEGNRVALMQLIAEGIA